MAYKQPYPSPDSFNNLGIILPLMGEALVYCIQEAIERNLPGCISYNADKDLLTYHLTISDLDRDLFDMLKGVEEIWIEASGGAES